MWERERRNPASVALVAAALILTIAWGVPTAGASEPPEFTVTITPGQPVMFDGLPASFTATTNPPGFEHQVQWWAVTRWGTVQPDRGQGQMFITVFYNTFLDPMAEQCQWVVVRAGDPDWKEFAEWKQYTEPDCIPDISVPAGDDCLDTDPCSAKSSFCTDPLPQDFFGAGSEQWRGEFYLQGDEEEEDDTIIERLDSMSFTGLDIQDIQVKLTKLRLVGCENITVVYDDETEKEFEVRVDESDFSPETGEMRVERIDDFGGGFESNFPVAVKYTFTDVEDSENEFVLDTGDPESGIDPIYMRTVDQVPWVAQLQEGIEAKVCGTNFVPGVRSQGNGGGGGGGGGPVRQCCKVIQSHRNPEKTHSHDHIVKQKCQVCPDGACYKPDTLACRQVLPDSCTAEGEVFMGEGTSCDDRDGDGLPNFAEYNDCCKADQVAQDAFAALSSPWDNDTDGDGVNDGDEILQDRDPCTPEP
ncbi:MAG: hypothetical protein GY842_02430 [bacterium]|nr:hypothetical protein [bacterium]